MIFLSRGWGLHVIRAEGPCWKGEVQIGRVVLQWQAQHPWVLDETTRRCMVCGKDARQGRHVAKEETEWPCA